MKRKGRAFPHCAAAKPRIGGGWSAGILCPDGSGFAAILPAHGARPCLPVPGTRASLPARVACSCFFALRAQAGKDARAPNSLPRNPTLDSAKLAGLRDFASVDCGEASRSRDSASRDFGTASGFRDAARSDFGTASRLRDAARSDFGEVSAVRDDGSWLLLDERPLRNLLICSDLGHNFTGARLSFDYVGLALPKKPAAMPPDVRKAFGLPARLFSLFGLRPICWGKAPKFKVNRNGSAQRFRTSGGRAAGVNHFLGKACGTFSLRAQADKAWHGRPARGITRKMRMPP